MLHETPRGPAARLVAIALRWPAVTVIAWLIAAGALTVGVPTLEHAVSRSTTPALPAGAPSLQALRVMDEAFGSGRAQGFAFVVIENKDGLDAADDAAYRELVRRLASNPEAVAEIQNYVDQPALRTVLTSRDGQATYIPIGMTAGVGSPKAMEQTDWLREQTEALNLPAGTKVYVTGDPALIADLFTAVNRTSDRITVVSVVLLVIVLLVIYRRFVTILIPLATIGVAVLCARGVLAALGMHGFKLSSYTGAFIMAVVLGAGTDYSVFLISRFREEFRSGGDAKLAVQVAGGRIGGALLASAGTVILGCSILAFTHLANFSTTGPPMAVAVAVTVLVSLTLTPVLMVWAGARIGPARAASRRHVWARAGQFVANRPGRVLTSGLLLLVLLALVFPTTQLSFDERKAQPSTTGSNRGYAAIDAHFPAYEVMPDYVLVRSAHDLRNPADLAALNTLSAALAKVPGVSSVRSVTQPAGTPIPQAAISSQLATLADKLRSADRNLASGQPGLEQLRGGSSALADGTRQLADGTHQAQQAVTQFVDGLDRLSTGLAEGSTKTRDAAEGAGQLRAGAQQLAGALQLAHDQTAQAVDGLGTIVTALRGDGLCTVDPVCNRARTGLVTIYDAQHDQLLPGLQRAADAAGRIATGTGTLADGLATLHNGLVQAQQGSAELAAGQRTFATKLDELSAGTQKLADGAAQLPSGIQKLIDETGRLSTGLRSASGYLATVHEQAGSPDAAGFYLPVSALNRADLAAARTQFLSADGHVARLQVAGTADPVTPQGIDRFNAVRATAEQSVRHTSLADAQVLTTGAGGYTSDLRDYLAEDARFAVVAVLLVVFLLLAITLRALVAPLYLLVSVILSCAAALGFTTLVWQHLLGHEIEFNVPIISFVLLVAVGADYNILLMARMRESGRRLTHREVADAVTATGPVITSAGVIFASTFVALIAAPIQGVAQTGFAVAAGLLLDTFVVRTFVVPACAALFGQLSWWPSGRDAGASRPLTPAPEKVLAPQGA